IRNNNIDLELYELGGDLRESLGACLCPAILNHDGAPLDPTQLAQPLHKMLIQGAVAEAVVGPRNPIVGGLPASCARAASGQDAAPPSNATKSRLFICFS